MQSIVNKLFYLHLFSFCFHFMALLYKSGKFLYYSYIRLTLENSISFSDSIAFVK